MFGLFGKSKPVKLRSFNDSKKYGIAAKNLKELLTKGCKLLQVPPVGSRVCLYGDGTEVTEEYFRTLPDHTELVLLSREQEWNVMCDIDRLLSTDSQHSDQLIEAVRELLSGEKSPKMCKRLGDLLLNLRDDSKLESREDHEDWFNGTKPVDIRTCPTSCLSLGIEARFKTKSAYMKHNCENRIRGYMKEVDSFAKTIPKDKVKEEFLKTAKCLMDMLKSHSYNGCYFDRTEKMLNRLCTKEGWFPCQGSFDQDKCTSHHFINPYSNRESRIVFSTWNLDHRIEKKRTVIPALLEAVQNHKSSQVNLNYFYSLLFTRENLKLVHIVCHKKGAHNLLCDSRKILKTAACTGKRAKGKRLCTR